jgi:hypothetical protein
MNSYTRWQTDWNEERLSPLRNEGGQQRRGVDWVSLPEGRKTGRRVSGFIKKRPGSKFIWEKITAWTSKGFSWNFENIARWSQGPDLWAFVLSKILQTVGKLLALERGGPRRSATKRVARMKNECGLKRGDMLFKTFQSFPPLKSIFYASIFGNQ